MHNLRKSLFFCLILIHAWGIQSLYGQLYQQWAVSTGNSPEYIQPSNNVLNAGNLVTDEGGNSYLFERDNNDIAILKVNNYGNLVWRVDGLPYPCFGQANSYTNGLFYRDQHIYFLSDSGIFKFDINGNLIWEWRHNNLVFPENEPLLKIDNGNNVILVWNSPDPISGVDDSICLVKIDTNGYTVWQNSYVDSGYTQYLTLDSFNNVYLSYTFWREDTSLTWHQYVFLNKYWPNGNLNWSIQDTVTNGGWCYTIETAPNGMIQALLYYGNQNASSMLLLDSSGNILKTRWLSGYYTPVHEVPGKFYYTQSSVDTEMTFVVLDSAGNTLNSYHSPIFAAEQSVVTNGNIYVIATSDLDTAQTAIFQFNMAGSLISTTFVNYAVAGLTGNYGGDVGATGGADAAGNIYLMASYENGINDSIGLFQLCAKCKPNVFGTVYLDSNQNCQMDSDEWGIESRIIKITPGPYYVVSNEHGAFTTVLPDGNYQAIQILPAHWSASCSDTLSIIIDSVNNVSDSNYFGSYPLPGVCDVQISMVAGNGSPGQTQGIEMSYMNLGSITDSGLVALTIDSAFIFTRAWPQPDSSDGNTFYWKYSNLRPGQSQSIMVFDSLPSYIPEAYIYAITSYITPVITDVAPANNYDTIVLWVLSSYDPNEKLSLVRNATAEGNMSDSSVLEYSISFQNTGNDTAFSITVADTLDPRLDVTTFTMLQSTITPYKISFEQPGIIRWVFPNALLPQSYINASGSVGFVKYSIKPLSGLQAGAAITNSATIYFDMNIGVTTNSTVNYYLEAPLYISSSGIQANMVSVYPNPFSDITRIRLSHPTGVPCKLAIHDITGRIIFSEDFTDDSNMEFERGALSQGVYFADIREQNTKLGTLKIVVQ